MSDELPLLKKYLKEILEHYKSYDPNKPGVIQYLHKHQYEILKLLNEPEDRK